MTVVFLTSRHLPRDDRIFFHMAMTLAEAGHRPVVISSRGGEERTEERGVVIRSFDGNRLSRKTRKEHFLKILHQFTPDVVICADPFAVHTARHFRKTSGSSCRIIYDVTEWYPSKKDLAAHGWLGRLLVFPGYLFYNVLAGMRTDAFIFGEWYKSRPFRRLFPRKDHLFLPYWPDLRYIPYKPATAPKDELFLTYSGKLSREKGFGHFLDVVKALAGKRPYLRIRVRVIGWYADEKEQQFMEEKIAALPPSVETTFESFMPFADYLEAIRDTHLFLDLRATDPENQRCLPIRIFYYAAFGRPVIYSDLKAIRREVDINGFGFLADPGDTGGIVQLIERYLDDEDLYLTHCKNARRLAEQKYNWALVKDDLIAFLIKQSAS